MKKIKFIFFCATFSLIFASCSTTEIPEDIPEPIIEVIAYNPDVKTIIDGSCVSCHSQGGAASFLILDNYSSVRNAAENGNLIARMNNASNPMPPSGILDAQTRATIDKWQDDGYLEN